MMIPHNQRMPHLKSVHLFNSIEVKGYLGMEMQRPILLPNSNYFQVGGIQFKLVPYANYDFKYITCLNMNKADKSMHVMFDSKKHTVAYSSSC